MQFPYHKFLVRHTQTHSKRKLGWNGFVGVYCSFLLASYDAENEEFQGMCNVGDCFIPCCQVTSITILFSLIISMLW